MEDERCHQACAAVVSAAKDPWVCSHALFECFSILTGGRLSVRLSAQDATALIDANIFQRMTVVTLTPRESMRILSQCESLGIRGGGIYDCLHLAAARKASADEIFTLNVRHFVAFAPDLAVRVREP